MWPEFMMLIPVFNIIMTWMLPEERRSKWLRRDILVTLFWIALYLYIHAVVKQ